LLTRLSLSALCAQCPNWFNDFQRRAIERSCRYAGLKCVRVLNDTTAAALAYGMLLANAGKAPIT
jgi:heat shock protein 4